MGFKYRESDPAVVKKRAESKGDYDRPLNEDFELFTAKEGKNRIRILPRTWEDSEGPRHWALDLFIHYGIGADNGRYPCPKRMGWGDCPICEEREALVAAGDEEAAKELRVSYSALVWIIDRNQEEKGPMLFQMPGKNVAAQICELSRDSDDGQLIKIDHPEEGFDVTFNRSGTGMKTSYSAVAIARKSSWLSQDEDEQEEWETLIEENPLPSVINRFDYDHIAKVFGGGASSRVEDPDDGEPAPRTRRSRARDEGGGGEEEPRRRRRSRASDDGDGGEDAPRTRRRSRSEEPEEPAPRTRRRSRGDDGGDDGGEAEEPRRRRRSREDEGDGEGGEEEPRRRRRSGRDLRDSVGEGLRSRRRRDDD